jgi:hypothetical protein
MARAFSSARAMSAFSSRPPPAGSVEGFLIVGTVLFSVLVAAAEPASETWVGVSIFGCSSSTLYSSCVKVRL